MPIRLNIEAESVEEFDKLIARFSRSGATAAIMPEIAHTPAAQEAVAAAEPAKGKGRTTKAKDTPAAAAAEASGSAAEASPPATAAVDPFAAAPAASESSAASAGSPEATSGTPAATSPADAAAAEAGEVTIQQLKDAMADLLKAKSASFAMQTLEQATGCKSLTSGSPSVVEKAKDDPTIFRKTLDALVAAKTAA